MPILLHSNNSIDQVNSTDEHAFYHPNAVSSNFHFICLSFSLNHSCAVTCLAYASTELGNRLGSICSGILYVSFAATALLVSNIVVTVVGSKNGLLCGVIGYCVFVIGFLTAILTIESASNIAWMVACVSAGVGGVAAGLLWTSQGASFSRHAQLYAASAGQSRGIVNSDFAAMFASHYLYSEVAAKIIATLVYYTVAPSRAPTVVFSLCAAVAVASCCMVAATNNMGDSGSWELNCRSVLRNASAVWRLLCGDRRLVLIVPFQVSFGLASGLVVYYVLGTVIAGSAHLGRAYVGVLSAAAVFSGAITAVPMARLANSAGKPCVLLLGSACLACTGLAFVLPDDATMGTWVCIVPYLLVFGVGRGIWENANKAAVADFFGSTHGVMSTEGTGTSEAATSTAAFSAVAFSTGCASAIGFFVFYRVSRVAMGGTVFVSAVVSAVCYHMAFSVDRSMTTATTTDTAATTAANSGGQDSSSYALVDRQLCSRDNGYVEVGMTLYGSAVDGNSDGATSGDNSDTRTRDTSYQAAAEGETTFDCHALRRWAAHGYMEGGVEQL